MADSRIHRRSVLKGIRALGVGGTLAALVGLARSVQVAPTPVSVSPKRIMLVEKHDMNRQLLSDYLVFYGFQILSLARGYGFFQGLADFQPNLILFDFMLPDINGFTLLEQLQRSSQWGHIPVIVVSGVNLRAERERAQSLGVRLYLVKPVDLNDLRQAIQKELGSSAGSIPLWQKDLSWENVGEDLSRLSES